VGRRQRRAWDRRHNFEGWRLWEIGETEEADIPYARMAGFPSTSKLVHLNFYARTTAANCTTTATTITTTRTRSARTTTAKTATKTFTATTTSTFITAPAVPRSSGPGKHFISFFPYIRST
jgi:hypothetical protein